MVRSTNTFAVPSVLRAFRIPAALPLAGPPPGVIPKMPSTRSTYALTFDALRAGLADFITVSEAELAAAVRLAMQTTHNLVEGAGAAGIAGLLKLRERLAGKRVGIVISGGNIDQETLRRVMASEI